MNIDNEQETYHLRNTWKVVEALALNFLLSIIIIFDDKWTDNFSIPGSYFKRVKL